MNIIYQYRLAEDLKNINPTIGKAAKVLKKVPKLALINRAGVLASKATTLTAKSSAKNIRNSNSVSRDIGLSPDHSE